ACVGRSHSEEPLPDVALAHKREACPPASPCRWTQSKNARSSSKTRRPTRRTTMSKPFSFVALKIRCRRPPSGGQGCCSVHCWTVNSRVIGIPVPWTSCRKRFRRRPVQTRLDARPSPSKKGEQLSPFLIRTHNLKQVQLQSVRSGC